MSDWSTKENKYIVINMPLWTCDSVSIAIHVLYNIRVHWTRKCTCTCISSCTHLGFKHPQMPRLINVDESMTITIYGRICLTWQYTVCRWVSFQLLPTTVAMSRFKESTLYACCTLHANNFIVYQMYGMTMVQLALKLLHTIGNLERKFNMKHFFYLRNFWDTKTEKSCNSFYFIILFSKNVSFFNEILTG